MYFPENDLGPVVLVDAAPAARRSRGSSAASRDSRYRGCRGHAESVHGQKDGEAPDRGRFNGGPVLAPASGLSESRARPPSCTASKSSSGSNSAPRKPAWASPGPAIILSLVTDRGGIRADADLDLVSPPDRLIAWRDVAMIRRIYRTQLDRSTSSSSDQA